MGVLGVFLGWSTAPAGDGLSRLYAVGSAQVEMRPCLSPTARASTRRNTGTRVEMVCFHDSEPVTYNYRFQPLVQRPRTPNRPSRLGPLPPGLSPDQRRAMLTARWLQSDHAVLKSIRYTPMLGLSWQEKSCQQGREPDPTSDLLDREAPHVKAVFLNPRAGGAAEGLPSVLSLVGLVARGSDGSTRSARGAGRLGLTPSHRRHQRHQDRHRRDGDPRSPCSTPGRRAQGGRLPLRQPPSSRRPRRQQRRMTRNGTTASAVVPFLRSI